MKNLAKLKEMKIKFDQRSVKRKFEYFEKVTEIFK